MNVIIHALLHIPPLRDYLLLSDFGPQGKQTELLKRFAGLAKKVWNPRLFKSQVSPHEFLQEVNRASGGKFRLEAQGDPVEFLGWLLNKLHKDMGGTKKRTSSACLMLYGFAHSDYVIGIIFSTFQGELRVETQHVLVRPDAGENERPKFDIDRGQLLHEYIFYSRLMCIIRYQIKRVAFPVPRSRLATPSTIPRLGREEHHSPSEHCICAQQI